MYLFKKINDLQRFLQQRRANGERIGFAPTMGALHEGHIRLIHEARRENELTVCSIFVNPTQFNDKEDLAKYPRPIEHDIQMLEKAGCSVLFLPEVEEIYPPNLPAVQFDLGYLDQPMEGASRPGHFRGVVQVVHRLLDIVQPDALYMGQKDFQQFTIIKAMLRAMQSPIRLVCVPIVREADGLAMSSRNVRLSPEGRTRAAQISQTLFEAQENAKTMPLAEVLRIANERYKSYAFEVDYLEVVNADTLERVTSFDDAPSIVACVVVKIDGVRLLDNALLKETIQ